MTAQSKKAVQPTKPVKWMSAQAIKVLRLFGHELSEENAETLAQGIGFVVVGVSNTLVAYGIYLVTLLLLNSLKLFPSFDYVIAQAVSFFLSVLWSYYWNSRYVFGSRSWRALLRTYVSYSTTGLLLSSVLLVLWVQVLHVSAFVAPFLNLLLTVPLNFLLNKFWAFRQ